MAAGVIWRLRVPDTTIGMSSPRVAIYRQSVLARTGAIYTVGYEPLILEFPGPPRSRIWELKQAACMGFFTTNPITLPGGPGIGWFIARSGDPLETLADAQAGINDHARGLALHMECNVLPNGLNAGYNIICQASGLPAFVLSGDVVRFIANVMPGTATPGPGAGSYCTAQIQIVEYMQ